MKMKKWIVLAMLLAATLMMTACGAKAFTCGLCNAEKTGKSHQVNMLGEKVTVCDECYKGMTELTNALTQ